VRQSLHRTWAALALAALAVLAIASRSAIDFLRDVYPECPGSLDTSGRTTAREIEVGGRATREIVYFDAHDGTNLATGRPPAGGRSFQLLYDEKRSSTVTFGTQYRNVRVVWKDDALDGTRCTCGTFPVNLPGETPSTLSLYRIGSPADNAYVVKGPSSRNDLRNGASYTFTIVPGRAHHLQPDRIFARRHLSSAVVLVALGALVVALLRSRRAMSYALRLQGWTEARLTPGGLVEGELGASLGTLEQTRLRRVAPGPVLVAPEALATSGLYRDMPIIARRHLAEGTHQRWAAGTLLRLRDARVLAVLSVGCSALAFGARLLA
jgi:hypothetical protein